MTKRMMVWAGLALFLVAPSLASAQPFPRVRRARPVVVLPPPPPAVVVQPAPIVVQPAPVVVRPAPAPAVVEEDDYVSPLSIGARVTGMGMEGYKLHLSDLENPVMGGAGIQLRSRFDDNFGVELAADFLGGSTDDFTQFQVPVTLSVLFYLFPESRIQPYFLAGGGVQFTELRYLGGAFEHSLTEVLGQLGVGADIWLTRRLSLNADLRFLGAYKNMGSRSEISAACFAGGAEAAGLCANIGSIDVDDRFNGGIQFLAGISYAF